MSVPDDPHVEAPVAVKLYTKSASVWLVAGAPTAAPCRNECVELMVDATRVFDVATGEERRWFAGPARKFAYDSYLFSFGESLGLQSGTS